jgi:3-oxocholest-4-en-26-oate---CoA ligase
MAVAKAGASDTAAVTRFRGGHDAVVLSEDRTSVLTEVSEEVGWLARRGRVALGYLNAPEATITTYPTINGTRYVILGDRARIAIDGTIEFLGRPESVINSGGEKVFADEVEAVIREHPQVRDAVVMGRPHPRWGSVVAAIVVPATPGAPPTSDEILAYCRRDLAAYKVPRVLAWADALKYTEVGKLDVSWARALLDADATDAPPSPDRPVAAGYN